MLWIACCVDSSWTTGLHQRHLVYYMKKGNKMSLWGHGVNSIYAGDAWLKSTKAVLVFEQREIER